MQIIFDSIEERDRFFDIMCMDNECWDAMKISNGIGERDCGTHSCRECWEKSGLKYKVEPTNYLTTGWWRNPVLRAKAEELLEQMGCANCKHEDCHEFDEPCRSCEDESNFEPKDDE